MIEQPEIMQNILLVQCVAEYAFEILSIERIKLHFESFEDDAIRRILECVYYDDTDKINCLFAAANNKNKDVKYFLSYLSKKLSDEELSTLFRIPSHFFVKENALSIFKQFEKNFNQKQFEEFLKINFERENFVEGLIRNGKYKTINWFFTKEFLSGRWREESCLRTRLHKAENSEAFKVF